MSTNISQTSPNTSTSSEMHLRRLENALKEAGKTRGKVRIIWYHKRPYLGVPARPEKPTYRQMTLDEEIGSKVGD